MNIPASNLANMLKSISGLNHVLNETLTLCKVSKGFCPACSYDPIRQESTNPHCDTCGGSGVIETNTFYDIPSSIETEQDFIYKYETVGRFLEGTIMATIDAQEINTILNVGNKFNMDSQKDVKSFLDQFSYFQWKGSKYVIKGFEVGYLQGNFYEIQVTLSLKEE